MGIKNLSKLIADHAPQAVKETELKALFGRKIAVDASMAIYQFLIAIRQQSNSMSMVNDQGKDTSHLVGLFYRTCKMLENGIKPIYVFDGKAPELKSGELEKRKERRKDAEEKLSKAETEEERNKMKKRLVRVTKQHNDDCKRLLELLGCPVITSPSEAEAQCAQLCKEGLVYAVATEDMDTLTFAAPKLIRNLSSGRADDKAKEYTFSKVLEGLEIDYDQFIDLCILMGCDYCDSINGIGGKKGLDLIKKLGSIEEILREKYDVDEFLDVEVTYKEKNRDEEVKEEEIKEEDIDSKDVKDEDAKSEDVKEELKDEPQEETIVDKSTESIQQGEEEKNDSDDENVNSNSPKKGGKREKKDPVPKNWLFRGARQLFKQPNVLVNQFKEADLKFKDVNEEGLIKFLVEENGFSEERIKPAIERVKKAKGKTNQSRIDSFFKVIPQENKSNTNQSSNKKRPSSGSASSNKKSKKSK